MTQCNYGDLVLVSFVYSDQSGYKKRPAVVVSSNLYNRSRSEIIIAGITSQNNKLRYGDYLMEQWSIAGLRYPSVVTAILQTIRHEMVEKKLGMMARTDLDNVEGCLSVAIGQRSTR